MKSYWSPNPVQVFLCLSTVFLLVLVSVGIKKHVDISQIDIKIFDHEILHIETTTPDIIPNEPAFPRDVIDKRHTYSYDSDDVILHLHIPKTGGRTFEMRLRTCSVNDTRLKQGWFFSWSTVGWPCGTHAGFYDYQKCDKDLHLIHRARRRKKTNTFNYLYAAILREPDQRVISEHGFTRDADEWPRVFLHCNHYIDDLHPDIMIGGNILPRPPQCLINDVLYRYGNLSLDYFLACENSYTTNRQLTMLANLSSTAAGCPPFGKPHVHTTLTEYRERWEDLLKSAKENLLKLSYFGLQEEQVLSMELFEWTLQLRFFNITLDQHETRSSSRNISDNQQENIQLLTTYEWDLYNFARRLFYERVKFMHEEKDRENSDGRWHVKENESAREINAQTSTDSSTQPPS